MTNISKRRLGAIVGVGVIAAFLVVAWGANRQPAEMESIVQVGHPGAVEHVVFHPNGRWFLTTGSRRPNRQIEETAFQSQAILWDLKSGQQLRAFPDAQDSLRYTNLLPQFALHDTAVAIAGHVYDLQTGQLLVGPAEPDAVIEQQAISPDSTQLALRAKDFVEVIDIQSGRSIHRLEAAAVLGHNGYTPSMAFNAGGETLVAVEDGTISTIWNVQRDEQVSTLEHRESSGVLLSPDGRWAYTRDWPDSGSSDIEIRIYEVRTGRFVVQLAGQLGGDSPLFLTGQPLCIVGMGQPRASLWDLDSGIEMLQYDEHDAGILTMQLLDSGRVLQTRTAQSAMNSDVRTGKVLQQWRYDVPSEGMSYDRKRRFEGSASQPLLPSPSGEQFFVGQVLVETATNKLRGAFRAWQSSLSGSIELDEFATARRLFSPDGTRVIVWYSNTPRAKTHLCDANTGATISEMAASPVQPQDVVWSSDYHHALVRSNDDWILWDVKRVDRLRRIVGAGQLAFSPNGQFVFSLGESNQLRFWQTATGEAWRHEDYYLPQRRLAPQPVVRDPDSFAPAGATAVSSDGLLAATVFRQPDGNRTWQVWDLTTGERIPEFADKAHQARSATFSPNSQYLAICNAGEAVEDVEIWDVATRQKLFGWRFENNPDRSWYAWPTVAFLSDNRHVVVNTRHRSLIVMNLEDGSQVHELVDTTAPRKNVDPHHRIELLMPDVLISPDERYCVAQYGTQYTILWDLNNGQQVSTWQYDNGNIPAPRGYRFSDDGSQLLQWFSRPRQVFDTSNGQSHELTDEVSQQLDRWLRTKRNDSFWRDLPPAVPAKLQPFANQFPESSLARFDPQAQVRAASGNQPAALFLDDNFIELYGVHGAQGPSRCFVLEHGNSMVVETADGRLLGDQGYVRKRAPGKL